MAESRLYSMESQLDEIETLIELKFGNIIRCVEDRKIELISKVKNYKIELSNQKFERSETLSEIGKLEHALGSIKSNTMEDIQSSLSRQISVKRSELSLKNQGSVKLVCDTCDIEQSISRLGTIIEEKIPNYGQNTCPNISIAKRGHLSSMFNRPTGVAIDEEQNQIFVVDSGNHRIQTYSMECEFIHEFDSKRLKDPYGIAIHHNNLYVTDIGLHSVLKYDCTSTPTFVKLISDSGPTQNGLRKPHGIAVNTYTGDVYVTDAKNNSVVVYSSDLEFKHTFGSDFLRHPVDVKIHGDNVYVLDNNKPCMHVFNMSGSPCQDIYFLNGSTPIETPLFFNIDCAGNFLVSNWRQDAVNIVRSEGDVKYTIESNAESGSVLKTPRGVAVTRSGRVVIVSDTPKNWIQIF